MTTQTMQTNFDCGPVALYNALKKFLGKAFTMTYQEFLAYWKFPNTGTFKDNLRDQPGDHLAVLRRLQIQHRRVDISELLDDKAPKGVTVVLLHDPTDPIMAQHWVRFIRFDDFMAQYYFDWGDGTQRSFFRDDVYKMFTAGLPDYAYCVGQAEKSQFKRLQNWAWLKLRAVMKFVTRS